MNDKEPEDTVRAVYQALFISLALKVWPVSCRWWSTFQITFSANFWGHMKIPSLRYPPKPPKPNNWQGSVLEMLSHMKIQNLTSKIPHQPEQLHMLMLVQQCQSNNQASWNMLTIISQMGHVLRNQWCHFKQPNIYILEVVTDRGIGYSRKWIYVC